MSAAHTFAQSLHRYRCPTCGRARVYAHSLPPQEFSPICVDPSDHSRAGRAMRHVSAPSAQGRP